MKTRSQLATTVATGALGPKLPPYTGDGSIRSLATTTLATAMTPKLPPFQGE